MKDSWQSVVAQLDILRTTFHFVEEPGLWAQAVHSTVVLDWSEENVTNGAITSGQITSWISSVSFLQNDQFTKPPIRFRLFVDELGESTLVLVMHHAVYDGFSLGKLLKMVQDLYHDITPIPSPPFSKFIPDILYEETEGIEFWKPRIQNISPVNFPRDISIGSEGSWQSRKVTTIDTQAVDRTCRRLEITTQAIGQAAWSKVLMEHFDSKETVFGQVISGRSLPESEDVIGPILVSRATRFKDLKQEF